MEMIRPPAIVVLCTAPRNNGESIGQVLVTEHLAACVNILKTRSLFHWEGTMNREDEDLLIIKTRSDYVQKIIDRIRELHSYDLPEIIVLPIIDGYAPYLQWITQETQP